MPKPQPHLETDLVRDWHLPAAATLGSSVRRKGIFLEVRARLPGPAKKALSIASGTLTLRMPEGFEPAFDAAATIVAQALDGIEALPILPREIEDILSITTTERHRWLKDGRLPSAGTRTVKLRGRARSITFHVFDPRLVEELQEGERIESWREDDALAAAERRRQAVWKAKLVRDSKKSGQSRSPDADAPDLRGWAEWERDAPWG